ETRPHRPANRYRSVRAAWRGRRPRDGSPPGACGLSAGRGGVRSGWQSGRMPWVLILGVAGGLAAAWVGAVIAYHWDVRRRTVAAVARAEIIVRRDLQPYLGFGPANAEREQWVLDRKDERVRSCEEDLRGLATERRRDRAQIRDLADELDGAWQAYYLIVWYFTLP